jgi:hypothetical protein
LEPDDLFAEHRAEEADNAEEARNIEEAHGIIEEWSS